MSSGIMDSDVTILDVLRKQGMLTVAQLSDVLSALGLLCVNVFGVC